MPLLVRVEARTEGQSNALSARILAFVRSLARSFFFSLWAKHRDEFV